MVTSRGCCPVGVDEVGPAPGPDAAGPGHARGPDELRADADRGDDRDLCSADQPGDAALRVPVAPEAARRRVEPGQVLGVAQEDRRPEQAVRRRLVETDSVRGGAGIRLADRHRAADSSSSVSSVTRPVASWGAVWR